MLGDDNIAGFIRGNLSRPRSNLAGELRRAVVLAVKENDDGGALGLQQREPDAGLNTATTIRTQAKWTLK
jgi:hypothetical protein